MKRLFGKTEKVMMCNFPCLKGHTIDIVVPNMLYRQGNPLQWALCMSRKKTKVMTDVESSEMKWDIISMWGEELSVCFPTVSAGYRATSVSSSNLCWFF